MKENKQKNCKWEDDISLQEINRKFEKKKNYIQKEINAKNHIQKELIG